MATTGSQAWRPNIASVHSQAVPEMNNMETQSWKDIASVYSQTVPKTEDRGNQTKKKTMVNTGTDAGNATIFDMTSNDEFDVDMTDAINQQENAEKKKKDNTNKIVESHLGRKSHSQYRIYFRVNLHHHHHLHNQ